MNTNNTVRPVDSLNIVTVVTDETQVNVTRPVTNVVRVVGPGPIGPVGPQGIQGETGLTVTDLFVARGNDTWSTTGSLQISGSLIVSQSVTGLSGFTGSLLGTAATASYYLETDPIFVAKSGSLATTGSNQFNGNQTITGSLIQGLEGNIASGEYSHAEGSIAKAIGNYSHAEGDNTQAKGNYSHAEGQETITLASAEYSHTEGYGTIALAKWQHVQGQWNATSSVESAFIVGNGTDNNNRSNLIHAAGNEVRISGSMIFGTGGITGSLLGTAATASFVTSSNVQGPHGMNSVVSASYAVTASYVNTLKQYVTLTGSLNVSGSVYIPTLTNDGQLYVLTYNTVSGQIYYTGSTSIGGVPQGNNGQIQYNNNQLLGGVPTLVYTDSLLKATGSFSGSFTGLLIGTAATASFVTSSNVQGPHGMNSIVSASYALTSSYINTLTQDVTISGSLFISGSTTQTGNVNVTGNYTQTGNTILSGSSIVTGSNILIGQSQITGSVNVSGSVVITGSLTANFVYLTGSLLGTAATASFVTSSNVQGPHGMNSIVSASYAVTASYVNVLTQDVTISGSLFTTGSNTLIGNTYLTGSLNVSGSTVQTGNNTLIGNTVLSGSIAISGSSTITGVTVMSGSLRISGSLTVTGSLTANFAYLTGSLLGTAATASFVTSSNVQGPYGMNSVVSASHAVTVRSYAQLIGDGATNNITVTHGLGTNDLHITVYSASGNFENIIPDIHRTDTNTIQVRFINPPTTGQYRVYISV